MTPFPSDADIISGGPLSASEPTVGLKECIGPTNGNSRCVSRQVTCPYAAQAKNMTAMKFLVLVLVAVVVAREYNWSGVKTLSMPRPKKSRIGEPDIFAHTSLGTELESLGEEIIINTFSSYSYSNVTATVLSSAFNN